MSIVAVVMQNTSSVTTPPGSPPRDSQDIVRAYTKHQEQLIRSLIGECSDTEAFQRPRAPGVSGKSRVLPWTWEGIHESWKERDYFGYRRYRRQPWELSPEPWLDVVHQHDIKEDLPRSLVLKDLHDESVKNKYYDTLERVIIRPSSVRLMSRQHATWSGTNTGTVFQQSFIRMAFRVPCTRKVCAIENVAFCELTLNCTKLSPAEQRDGWTGAGSSRVHTVLRCKCGVVQCITLFYAGTMYVDIESKGHQWVE